MLDLSTDIVIGLRNTADQRVAIQVSWFEYDGRIEPLSHFPAFSRLLAQPHASPLHDR